MVNTCGFVEAAKKDSVDTLLAAADLKGSGQTRAVVAVGCLAERYGKDLAASLPEADAVLGFDDYPDIASRLRSILAGETLHPHTPHDRRLLLPDHPRRARRVDGVGAGDGARPHCLERRGPGRVPRRAGRAPYAVAWTADRWPRSSWPAAATAAAPSARSPASAARS